jgi:hypothetical protein
MFDRGDVCQPIEAIVDEEVDLRDAGGIEQRPRDLDQDILVLGVDDARRNYRILVGNGCENLVEIQAERGQLCRREGKIDLLLLVAEDFDLVDIGRALVSFCS